MKSKPNMFRKFAIAMTVAGLVVTGCDAGDDDVTTETDGETYAVWGPHTDALSPATWRVRVDRVGDGRFHYVVEGWPKDEGPDAAVTVLEGDHTRRDIEGHGHGQWTYHLTEAHRLDPIAHDATGAVSVDYDVAAERTLEVRFDAVQGPADPLETSSLYRYTEAEDGAGTFDYIANFDIHDDADTGDPELDRRELVQVRSRWLDDGPGRADVIASHGDLQAGAQVTLVECWDDAFLQTYVQFTWADYEHEDGDLGACPYDQRETPEFEDFDADDFADEGLIEALPEPGDFDANPGEIAEPVSEPALYYTIAKQTIEGLNTHVKGVLDVVQSITRNPPSNCTPGGCVWGPWTDWDTRITYRLDVDRIDATNYAYQLGVKPFGAADEDWVTLIEGGFVEIADRASPEDGQGWFVFDFDVVARFDPNETNRGSFRAEYAKMGDESMLAVRLDGVREGDDAVPNDGRYFLHMSAAGGELNLGITTDINENEPHNDALERLEARIRWVGNGRGVATVQVTEGDVPQDHVGYFVECWDDRAERTYTDFAYVPEGDPVRPPVDSDACVFDDWAAPEFPPMGDEL